MRAAFAVLVVVMHAGPALAAVIDEITVERRDAPRVTLRLTGPVHYIRDYASADGELVNVQLQALAPLAPGGTVFPAEVQAVKGEAAVPPFTVRISLDPNPICVLIQFERPVRCRVRLGEDRRSLLLDFPAITDKKKRSPGPST